MGATRYLLYITCLFFAVYSGHCGYPVPDEQRLYEVIMMDYQKSVRPVINASAVVIVKFALRLNQIVGLDERQQVLTTNVFIDQEWVDESLSWSPTDFNGIRSLRVAGHNVWLPDTFMFNNADDGSTGFMSGTFVQVHYDGTVLWPVPVKLKSSCKVDITYFPFDDQECILKFGSWIYSGLWVDYVTMFNDTPIDLAYYVNNSEWKLLSVTLKKNIRKYACCPEPHPDLTFVLHIRRKTFYYIFNIIVPCIMLSILTLLTFWLPPKSGEKVTLGLNVFLAFSMFMLLVAEQVPATSEAVPLIGIYLCVVMTMTSVSVIMAVIVINVYNRGMKMRRAPPWLRTLTLKWTSKVLRITHNVELIAKRLVLDNHMYDVTKRPDTSQQIRKSYSKFDVTKPFNSPIFKRHNNNSEGFNCEGNTLRYRQNTGEDQTQWRTEHDAYSSRQEDQAGNLDQEADAMFRESGESATASSGPLTATQGFPFTPNTVCQTGCQHQTCQYASVSSHSYPNRPQEVTFQGNPSSSSASARFDETADDTFEAVPVSEMPHIKNIIVAEWQSIAIVVDRCLFWFYLIVTFTAYVIILVIVPAQHFKEEKRGLFMEGNFT